jgi:cytoskeletal protein CcmA (bactofilin family)
MGFRDTMFGRKKRSVGQAPSASGAVVGAAGGTAGPSTPKSFSRQESVMPESTNPDPPVRPEIPRRRLDIPGMASRQPDRPSAQATESKRLIVGRDITLSGEITACDRLIVEGRVEAKLADCQSIEISSTGLFKGSVEVDNAVISGQFEGKLTVRKRLAIHATGRVTGEIRYAEIEIQAGGVISGDVHGLAGPAAGRAPVEPGRDLGKGQKAGAGEAPPLAAEQA